MTFKKLKSLSSGLLAGDTAMPEDHDTVIALLEMALDEIASQATSLHLLTINKDGNIHRMGVGEFMVRKPELPTSDEDEIDIDNELCFPLARFLAGYLSTKKTSYHQSEGNRLIKIYNSKVNEVLENTDKDAKVVT